MNIVVGLYKKTGLFQVADVTVGGPTGAGLSGGEVINYCNVLLIVAKIYCMGD